jgi:hypothetical protein
MSDDAAATAAETIESYYDALRAGDPLGPFFADAPGMVKFGVGETLVGADDIVAGLRDQTETTTDWTVESRNLTVTERDDHAWFSDDVLLAWTDADSGTGHEFETRWSGTLELADGDWQFVAMHVSTPHEGGL